MELIWASLALGCGFGRKMFPQPFLSSSPGLKDEILVAYQCCHVLKNPKVANIPMAKRRVATKGVSFHFFDQRLDHLI